MPGNFILFHLFDFILSNLFSSFSLRCGGPRQPSRAWVVAGGCRWWERDHHTRRMTSMGQGAARPRAIWGMPWAW